jgi:hypothetical protein
VNAGASALLLTRARRLLEFALGPRSRGSRWVRIAVAGLVAGASNIAPARAQDEAKADAKAICIRAYEASQVSRKDRALRVARQQLLTCASDACPAVVRTDCVQWLAEVEAATPSIVLEARAAAGPVFDVTVKLDGAPLVTQLDGRSLELDPGLHTLTFDRTGSPTLEQKIIVREGEKNRLVSADWSPKTVPGEKAPPVLMERPVPAAVYVTLGVAALGFVDFAVAGSIGLAKKQSLEHASPSCVPFCSASDVNYIKTAYAVADVGLGVGVAGLVASAILFFARPERPVHSVQSAHSASASSRGGGGEEGTGWEGGTLVVQSGPSGALVGWRGSF